MGHRSHRNSGLDSLADPARNRSGQDSRHRFRNVMPTQRRGVIWVAIAVGIVLVVGNAALSIDQIVSRFAMPTDQKRSKRLPSSRPSAPDIGRRPSR